MELTQHSEVSLFSKDGMADKVQQVEYASFNRRLIAATIDVMTIVLLLTPILNLISGVVYGTQNPYDVMNNFSEMVRSGNAQPLDFINYIITDGFLYKYLINQTIALFFIGLYFVIAWYKKGCTLGKFMTGCRIVDDKSHRSITLAQAIIRFLGYILSTLPFGFGFFISGFTKKRQCLHYIIASTVIIIVKNKVKEKKL